MKVLSIWMLVIFLFIKIVYADPYVDETWLGSGNDWCQFAIISDPHIGAGPSDYGTSGWNDSPPDIANEGYYATILRGVVNWINENRISERIRFVIVTGDLTQSAEISELKKAYEILNTLSVPWIPLIGNHDVWPYIGGVSNYTQAPEELSDSYFNNTFAPQYQHLANVLPNFVKCPIPIWNWEVDLNHNSYFQDFAFDYPTGNKIWHFMCLDFNARDNATMGWPGVAAEADLCALSMDNKTTSIKVYSSDSRGVILYGGANPDSWEGRSETFFSNDANLSSSNWIGNDVASSIRIVGNCAVRLHKDTNYKGSIVRTSSNISNLGSSTYNFNDKTSSVKVSNGYLHGRLRVYYDENHLGIHETFIANDHYLTGNYIGNDKISSFKIWGPCKVTFYRDANFGGSTLVYNVASGAYYERDNMPLGWNDKVSSIKIENCDSRGVILYAEAGIDNNNNCQLTLCYNDDDLRNNAPEFNDVASAVKIVGACEATLYVDIDYKGFLEATGPGFYKLSDYNLNNEVSSIEVVNGYINGRVELYANENYGSIKEIFIYNDNNLEYNYLFDSLASSIKVYPGTNGCYARLYEGANYTGDAQMTVNANDPRLAENGAYAWWRDHLRNYPNKTDENILIFAHHPLYNNASYMFSGGEYSKIASLLYQYKNSINAWFAGHYHNRLSGEWWPPWPVGWSPGTDWDIIYSDAVVCRGYYVDANCLWPGPFYTGFTMLVRLQYSTGLKNLIAQSDIPEATGYNNTRRLLNLNGVRHLVFTRGENIYHTFSQDTTWSEPVCVGTGKYPAVSLGPDGKLYCTWAFHGYKKWYDGKIYYFEYLMMSSYNGTTWAEPQILFHTYGTFLWGVGAPSMAIKDTMAYVTFKSYHGPHPHPTPGFPVPHIIVDEGPALIYGTFSPNNPVFSWTYADTIIKRLIPVDTLVYQDSLVPLLISPSITIDMAGVPHILWEGDSTCMRYYTITDSIIIKQPFDSAVDFPSLSMNGDQIQLFYTARDSIRYRYGWTGTNNLSETQTVATCENPIASGPYLTWTKQEDELSHLYYGVIPSSGIITPFELTASTNLINYPQIIFNSAMNNQPASLDFVWTEYNPIDSVGYIYYSNLPLQQLPPLYAFDMGRETPVPILVERDGYIAYGAEDYKTIDYDSTELVYHLTLHSPHTKYKIRWVWYHEELNKIKLQFNVDDILHRNRWVNPGELVVEEVCLPDATLHDNKLTIKIKVLNGTIAVLSGFEIYIEQVGVSGPQGSEAIITRPFFFDKLYPNPAKGMLKIRFHSPDARKVTVKLYDVVGRLAKNLFSGKAKPGTNEIPVMARDFPAGVYFVRIEAAGFTETKKVVLLK